MIKLSLYDFDRTIYSKDTGAEITLAIIKANPIHTFFFIPKFLFSLIKYFLKIDNTRKFKENAYSFVERFTKSEWDLFITDFWNTEKQYFFSSVTTQMQKDHKEGFMIGIISASPETMIYPVMEFLPADFLIGTRMASNGDYLSSAIIGKNCKNAEKVNRLHEYMKDHFQDQPYETVKMYSDSLHDLPLFEIAQEQYTVEADGTIRSGLPLPNNNM